MDFLGSLLTQVEIRTAFTPPVILTGADLFSPSPAGGGGQLTKFLKPTALITLSGQSTPITVAPGGEAGPDDWQAGAATLLLFAAAYTYMVYKAGQKSRLK